MQFYTLNAHFKVGKSCHILESVSVGFVVSPMDGILSTVRASVSVYNAAIVGQPVTLAAIQLALSL